MREIHVTWKFLEANGLQVYFFEKKNVFRYGRGGMGTKFQVCIFFFGQKAPYRHTYTQTNRHTYLQVKIGISSIGYSSHADFDKKK